MFDTHYFGTSSYELINSEQTGSLSDIIHGILEVWHEDYKVNQMFWITDEKKNIRATMTTGADTETVIVTYQDGTQLKFTVRYVLNEEGNYEYTSILPIL